MYRKHSWSHSQLCIARSLGDLVMQVRVALQNFYVHPVWDTKDNGQHLHDQIRQGLYDGNLAQGKEE